MMAPGVILHAELISVVYFHKSLLLSPRAVHYRFPFQASIHINTKSARFKGRTYLADDPLCIHLHNNN